MDGENSQRYEPHARDGFETGCENRLTRRIVHGTKQLGGLKTNLFLFRRRPRERASRLGPYSDDGVRCADESAVAVRRRCGLSQSRTNSWPIHLSSSLKIPALPKSHSTSPRNIGFHRKNGLDAEKMFVACRWRPSLADQVGVTSQKLAIPIVSKKRVWTQHALVDKIQQ